MAGIFTDSSAYQGTFVPGTIQVDPIFQVCAVASINASNQFELTFWVNENGQRVDNNLGQASFQVYDKAGNTVAINGTGLTPDVNGFYHSVPVLATLIYDLTHYVVDLSINVDGFEKVGSIGLVVGE